MNIDEITEYIDSLSGVLILKPQPGDGSPEISWGDVFFYYAPDGVIPATQPFATIVTKDYPDETGSGLDRSGAFRVNIASGAAEFQARTGREPRDPDPHDTDPATTDVVFAHPVYGNLGWLCVVEPGVRTTEAIRDLLHVAHDLAQARYERRINRPG